jgi:hypothetical protein
MSATVVVTTRKLVEELRQSAQVDRIPISQSAKDLTQYCVSKAEEDPFLPTFRGSSDHPLKQRGSRGWCTTL